jgi:uncharacterized protein (DUF433 family)
MLETVPGIECTPGVIGGEACIAGTRIPVWLLVRARQLGSSDVDIIRAYPTLQATNLFNAWTYYLAHETEIDQQIVENESA